MEQPLPGPDTRLRVLTDTLTQAPDAVAAEKLSRFIRLLHTWSGRVRLVSRSDRDRLLGRHVVDSLLGLSLLPDSPATLLDLGSGAGLPGLPLKILRPDLHLKLVESARMKALFLEEAVTVLSLREVEVCHERAEAVAAREGRCADIVTGRAVAALPRLWELAEPLLRPSGFLLAWKGPGELAGHGLPAGVTAVETLVQIPGSQRKRALVRVQKVEVGTTE